jgi:hypothetical protein
MERPEGDGMIETMVYLVIGLGMVVVTAGLYLIMRDRQQARVLAQIEPSASGIRLSVIDRRGGEIHTECRHYRQVQTRVQIVELCGKWNRVFGRYAPDTPIFPVCRGCGYYAKRFKLLRTR